jgi:hypothetical protein
VRWSVVVSARKVRKEFPKSQSKEVGSLEKPKRSLMFKDLLNEA